MGGVLQRECIRLRRRRKGRARQRIWSRGVGSNRLAFIFVRTQITEYRKH